MNCISTKIYADPDLSIKFPSRLQEGNHPVETQKNWNSEMRLRRFKLENGCHESSFIFAGFARRAGLTVY